MANEASATEARVGKSHDVTPFQFEGRNVRLVEKQGETWFFATDVARELGYSSAKDLTRTLDDDEKGGHIVPTLGGDQEISVISEPGLYRAIIQRRANKKHDASLTAKIERFQRWVFHDVLPSIRRFGVYIAPAAAAEFEISPAMAKVIGGIVKAVLEKRTEDMRAGIELAVDAMGSLQHDVAVLKATKVAPTFDFADTVTSAAIMDMAAIPRMGRVRGTTGGIITRAMKDFCLQHGYPAKRTPEDIDAQRRWRFPRQAAIEWLNGRTLGGEVIRAHIAKSQAARAGKAREAQTSLRLLAPPNRQPTA